ncbi:hypothetical protein APB53_14000 [Pseudomonas aeruginosa]|uniref:hypothetical protein n=1 Tax=Pseudomonas aeruginosa TaxID=287 RepID=UPI00071B6E5C|nr:hypothetical protein [Pseudomonas aeruginosa]KSR43096.1 hypothetical protein APB53_14000 [Pseudomonas aeruginosa]RPV08062.1 hypothetical protein IPC880_12335 [Pseudomonas aeruginosa]
MSVQVVDLKTGKVKSMPKRFAEILVKIERARWPEEVAEAAPVPSGEPICEVAVEPVETPAEVQVAPKKRSRKPKVQE